MTKRISAVLVLMLAFAMMLPVGAFAETVQKEQLKIDGQIDARWAQTDRIAFNDSATGTKGYYRLMWDEGSLFVLAELTDAAKWWTDSKKPFLLSLWYNTEGRTSLAEGFAGVTWPYLEESNNNGLFLGTFVGSNITQADSVQDGNVILEWMMPWTLDDGDTLESDSPLGLGLTLRSLDPVTADASGKYSFAISGNLISQSRPSVLNEATLLADKDVTVEAGDDVAVDLDVEGITFEANATSGTSNAGGNNSGSTTGNGGVKVEVKGGSNGSAGVDAEVEAGAGVTVGVIPSAMPRTGGGGASEWTD